jgi:glycosyltransferase involved in cell wall biosynthesis
MSQLVFAASEILRSQGGIPRYNRLLQEGFRRFAQEQGWRLRTLSLNDSRLRFSAALAGLRGPGVLVLGHVAFVPFVPWLRQLGWRTVVMAHGIEVWARKSLLHRVGLHRVDEVWAVSRYTAQRMAQAQGLSDSVIHLLPGALPLEIADRFRPSRASPTPLLLTVTRLDAGERYKGVDLCLQAVAQLRQRLPALRYEIVGEGSDLAHLSALAERLGLTDVVHFRGRVGDEELLEAYRRAWAFVLPSTGEGFGLVVLEAWAAHLPVVVADAAASPELVEDGVSGVLVPPYDSTALAARLEALITSPASAREALAREGFARLKAHHLPQSFYQRVQARLVVVAGTNASSSLST